MKISRVKSRPTLYIDNLNIGDLFEYEKEIYMKIEQIDTIDHSYPYINAVNLEQGIATTMYNDEIIEPIYEDDYIFEVDCNYQEREL